MGCAVGTEVDDFRRYLEEGLSKVIVGRDYVFYCCTDKEEAIALGVGLTSTVSIAAPLVEFGQLFDV